MFDILLILCAVVYLYNNTPKELTTKIRKSVSEAVKPE